MLIALKGIKRLPTSRFGSMTEEGRAKRLGSALKPYLEDPEC
jgi:hypothetical protein